MSEPSPRCLCGHVKEAHFSCEIGSFCNECPKDNHIWEHVFQPSVSGGAPPTERCEGMGGSCELPKGHKFACACNIPLEKRWDGGQAATPAPPQDARSEDARRFFSLWTGAGNEHSYHRANYFDWEFDFAAAFTNYYLRARAASERAPEPTCAMCGSNMQKEELGYYCNSCQPRRWMPLNTRPNITALVQPASQPTEESK